MEIALRTPGALAAIEAVRASESAVTVGAGTVTTAAQLEQAVGAGASFAVSPGSSHELLVSGGHTDIPFIPGVATATELMRVVEAGFREVKVFPAEPAGGIATVASLEVVFPGVRFLPTDARSRIDGAGVRSAVRSTRAICCRILCRSTCSSSAGSRWRFSTNPDVTTFSRSRKRFGGEMASSLYDPDHRPALWGDRAAAVEWTHRIAPLADQVLASVDDGRQLTGREAVAEIAAAFRDMGALEVVVTDGPRPCAIAFDDRIDEVEVQPPPLVIETTTAG